MKYHFIAIGGSVMHNLALDIHQQGNIVTGSDDEIFEPSKSRLEKAGLLPIQMGWFPQKITNDLDAVILGMHAHKDNPELLKALEMGIRVYSYPEFMYKQSLNKKRIVVGGSHGKTTITSMIMHVLRAEQKNFDYLVGAQLDGFDRMVKIDPSSNMVVFEGDEYLASTLDLIPKFHLYHPHVAIISGIAWDHMNVFPTFENYCDQFSQFIQKIEKGGKLIYCEKDPVLVSIVNSNKRDDIEYISYTTPDYMIINEETMIIYNGKQYEMKVFGEHNLMNMEAAHYACESVGVKYEDFLNAMQTFTGAAKRLELMHKSKDSIVYKDFAHSPSKLTATIQAVRNQYPKRKIYAFVELHTYSSLNKTFLEQYKGTMDNADLSVVFYSPHTLELKKLPAITKDDIRNAFSKPDLNVANTNDDLIELIENTEASNSIYLMMSSGNWNGVNVFDLLKNKIGN
jgi:UDP-N-acetylmuramate: L-alanyl-gamma-D-glutamyl-meso-diaminopimelate ligase